MNGKNRRTRGCWSRGNTIFSSHRSRGVPPAIKYNLPVFSSALKSNLNSTQNELLGEFEHFTYLPKYEEYSYGANTPKALIRLRNSHFTNGTVRITKPGIYILQEDIVFEPNATNDFFPTHAQIASGQFPMGTQGAYHLGFFAAITVETTGVILDLNSHTIKQSKLHNLEQRFYANIEFASAPFIPAQGPATFSTSSNYVAANGLLVRNGTLGTSSHHGIHGNGMSNIVIDNVTIEDFEVAGIALKGATTGVINKTVIRNASQKIPVLSTYSQARFIRSFLTRLQDSDPDASIRIEGVDKNIDTIISELNDALIDTKNKIMSNKPEEINTLFRNNTQLYDGNLYGIVLNEKGVVVNGFILNRDDAVGNIGIHLQDITISNLVSQPVEIIGLSTPNPTCTECVAYGTTSQAGPIGDILQIENITDTNDINKYKPTVLANAQLIIGKYNTPKKGTTSITSETVKWVKDPSNLDIVMANNHYYYVNGGDSMGHIMKGSIGLFISAGKNVTGDTIAISGVVTKGTQVGTSPLITDGSQNYQGATANGILFTGSETVTLTNTMVNNITSEASDNYAHLVYSISSSDIWNNGQSVPNDEM
ncbi:MAG: hypothetical protein V3W20_12350 [Candidatus Neomarinimicrobiota bacterium]